MPASPIIPGAHLYWAELACHDAISTPYPIDCRATVLIPKLLPAFEAWRSRLGDRPGIILSAYRTKDWNQHVGGEDDSFHVRGAALDVAFEGVLTIEAARAAVREARAGKLIRGVGYYPDHGITHIDVGPRPAVTLWRCVMTLKHGQPVRVYLPWDGETA